jgi:hypothetical protein
MALKQNRHDTGMIILIYTYMYKICNGIWETVFSSQNKIFEPDEDSKIILECPQ